MTLSEHEEIVPLTYQIKLGEEVGSLQKYEDGCISLGDIMCEKRKLLSLIPSGQIQRILFFNLLIGNTDANTNNVLIQQSDSGLRAFSIDHGGAFSRSLQDPIHIGFLNMPQLSYEKFDKELIQAIESFDVKAHVQHLASLGFQEEQLATLQTTYEVFKQALEFNEENEGSGVHLSPGDVALVIMTFREELIKHPGKVDVRDIFHIILQRKAALKEVLDTETPREDYLYKESTHLQIELGGSSYSKLITILTRKILPQYSKNHPRKAILFMD